jgi:hypothetical protein
MFANRTIASSILIVGVATAAMAQAPVLDVKLGLWENTIVTDMGGAVPKMDTSKMPPEQAAKIAEMMKGLTGERTIVERNCLTKEDLAKDSFMLPDDSKQKCTRTITTNTASRFTATINCTGERETRGEIDVQSSGGGTAYTNTMKMATTGRGQTMNLTMKMTGKYLGPACGDVK